MKKIIVVFALLLSLSAIAQDFPGKRPELLLGKEVKVTPFKITEYEKGYKKFYSDIEMRKTYLEKEKYSSFTPIEQLEGRMFKVTAVDADQDPENKGDARLTLVDEIKGETIYYRYLSYLKDYFHFEAVGGLKLPADLYCDYITEKADKFKAEIIFTGEFGGIAFLKVKKGAAAKYYMSINAPLDKKTLEVGKKGVIVLLAGNKRIEKPNVELQIMEDQHKYYNATFELSLKELNLLIDNAITDTRVGTYDSEIENSVQLKGILDCLITK